MNRISRPAVKSVHRTHGTTGITASLAFGGTESKPQASTDDDLGGRLKSLDPCDLLLRLRMFFDDGSVGCCTSRTARVCGRGGHGQRRAHHRSATAR